MSLDLTDLQEVKSAGLNSGNEGSKEEGLIALIFESKVAYLLLAKEAAAQQKLFNTELVSVFKYFEF
jgi:hypothetical protein